MFFFSKLSLTACIILAWEGSMFLLFLFHVSHRSSIHPTSLFYLKHLAVFLPASYIVLLSDQRPFRYPHPQGSFLFFPLSRSKNSRKINGGHSPICLFVCIVCFYFLRFPAFVLMSRFHVCILSCQLHIKYTITITTIHALTLLFVLPAFNVIYVSRLLY